MAPEDLTALRDELLALHQKNPETDAIWEWFQVVDEGVESLRETNEASVLLDAVEELADLLVAGESLKNSLRAFFLDVQELVPWQSPSLQQSITKAQKSLESTDVDQTNTSDVGDR